MPSSNMVDFVFQLLDHLLKVMDCFSWRWLKGIRTSIFLVWRSMKRSLHFCFFGLSNLNCDLIISVIFLFQLVKQCLHCAHQYGLKNGYVLVCLTNFCTLKNWEVAWPFEVMTKTCMSDWEMETLGEGVGDGAIFFFYLSLIKHRITSSCWMLTRLWKYLLFEFVVTFRYFIATNATSTFRSIVCTYPGQVVLVSIQVGSSAFSLPFPSEGFHVVSGSDMLTTVKCNSFASRRIFRIMMKSFLNLVSYWIRQCPNPDFSDPDHRWRMLQRSLVEAIADLLAYNGKVKTSPVIPAVRFHKIHFK